MAKVKLKVDFSQRCLKLPLLQQVSRYGSETYRRFMKLWRTDQNDRPADRRVIGKFYFQQLDVRKSELISYFKILFT